MPPSDLTLPHFLGIGVVKAGTTWLHNNLRCHPDLYLPLQKPVYYWDKHVDKPLERYARIFQRGRDRIRGEFTASYSVLSEDTIRRIRELLPDLRAILLLREPKSRAWSEAKMEFSVVNRKTDVTEEDYLRFLRSPKCLERGDYVSIINRWTKVFGREQVFVDFYDDVRDAPRQLMERVLEFLGVRTDIDWGQLPLSRTIFKGVEKPLPESCARALDELYDVEEFERIAGASGLDVLSRWKHALKSSPESLKNKEQTT